jgi:hypothetical protein
MRIGVEEMPTYNRDELEAGSEDFMGYAEGDGAFAAWCEEVDRFAGRFCNVSFFQFEDVMDTLESYREGIAPLPFFRECIVPEIVCDMGYDYVEEVVADNVMWGNNGH